VSIDGAVDVPLRVARWTGLGSQTKNNGSREAAQTYPSVGHSPAIWIDTSLDTDFP